MAKIPHSCINVVLTNKPAQETEEKLRQGIFLQNISSKTL